MTVHYIIKTSSPANEFHNLSKHTEKIPQCTISVFSFRGDAFIIRFSALNWISINPVLSLRFVLSVIRTSKNRCCLNSEYSIAEHEPALSALFVGLLFSFCFKHQENMSV